MFDLLIGSINILFIFSQKTFSFVGDRTWVTLMKVALDHSANQPPSLRSVLKALLTNLWAYVRLHTNRVGQEPDCD